MEYKVFLLYSRKCWRSLNITVLSRAVDIGGFKLGGMVPGKYWRILIWWLYVVRTTKPPNFHAIQYLTGPHMFLFDDVTERSL